MKLQLLLKAVRPASPALLYIGGLTALVIAGFLFTVIAGFLTLGVSLFVIGYMAEVNQP